MAPSSFRVHLVFGPNLLFCRNFLRGSPNFAHGSPKSLVDPSPHHVSWPQGGLSLSPPTCPSFEPQVKPSTAQTPSSPSPPPGNPLSLLGGNSALVESVLAAQEQSSAERTAEARAVRQSPKLFEWWGGLTQKGCPVPPWSGRRRKWHKRGPVQAFQRQCVGQKVLVRFPCTATNARVCLKVLVFF